MRRREEEEECQEDGKAADVSLFTISHTVCVVIFLYRVDVNNGSKMDVENLSQIMKL